MNEDLSHMERSHPGPWFSLSNNGVLRMLLRMLSACHPGNGANRLIRLPDAVPGQDQDSSKETIVEHLQPKFWQIFFAPPLA